jgi:ABC-2 type transport system permease protein
MSFLVLRIIRQIRNDRRTLALLIFAPILLITLIYLILGESDYTPTIATRDVPTAVVAELASHAAVTTLPDDKAPDKYLKAQQADAVLSFVTGKMTIQMLESSSKTALVSKAVQDTLVALNPASQAIAVSFIYGQADETQFDSLSYVFLGILSFFFVFIVAGMSLVRERFAQTLERMLMTPIRRHEVIAGYTLGFGVFAAIQSIVMVLYTRYVLGLHSAGSILLCILVMILMAFVAVSMGALVSIFANSEFQVAQFIPVVIVPQTFFSGLIPLDTIPFGLGRLSYAMPIYYGCTALKKIMIEAAGIVEILPWLLGLAAYLVVLFFLNTLALKKYRHI